jgi:hypothetical protein
MNAKAASNPHSTSGSGNLQPLLRQMHLTPSQIATIRAPAALARPFATISPSRSLARKLWKIAMGDWEMGANQFPVSAFSNAICC